MPRGQGYWKLYVLRQVRAQTTVQERIIEDMKTRKQLRQLEIVEFVLTHARVEWKLHKVRSDPGVLTLS